MKKTDLFRSFLQSTLMKGAFLLLFLSFQSSILYSQCAVKSQSSTGVDCFGNTTGTITLVMENTVPPVNYVWGGPTPGQLNGQGDSIVLTSLEAGLYSITVNDAGSCAMATEITVGSNPQLIITESTIDVDCNGGATGSATAIAVGGVPPYEYTFNDGSTGSTATGLAAGFYSVTVSDDIGCTASISFIINEPASLNTTVNAVPSECGQCTGSATLIASGGTAPYLFGMNGVPVSGGTFTDLCAGTYAAVVTDANGCSSFISFIINDSNNELNTQTETDWLECDGACAGAVQVLIQCGLPPFTIDWSDDSLDGSFEGSGLCAGLYSYTLTDGDGSQIVDTFALAEPAPISITDVITNVDCNGSCSGAIDLTVVGGNPPYSYTWSPTISTVEDPTGLCAGAYTVTVTDRNGCTAEYTTVIDQPNELEANLEINDVDCMQGGSITVNVSGGTAPYAYDWSNGISGLNSITDLEAGAYSVTVSDQNGCVIVLTGLVETPIQLDVSSTSAACDSTGGTATVTIVGTTIPNPAYEWSTGGIMATEPNLAPGWYSVTVTDTDNDCRVHRNVQVPLDTACFVRISGYVYIDDVNRDCAADATTTAAANILVELSNGDATFTDQNGYYEFNPLPGNFTASIVLNGNQYESLCTTPIDVNAADFGGNYPDNNFYLNYSAINNLVLKISKNNARPGFIQPVRICVMNRGAVPMDGTLTFVHDPIQEFENSNPTQSDYDMTSQTLTWDFTDHPAGVTIIYRVNLKIPVGTALGTPLNMYFKVDPIIGDIAPDDNEVNCAMVVTGSYDPNDKQVTPSGEGEEGNISRQDSILSYQIRFQNTGTDTAFTVVVRDTLDDNLDVSTVVPGPASHDYKLTVLKGNILEFTFDNILLPDSFVNEPASNGFVFFDVQVKQGLEYGTAVANTASIFFDFNEPIITNTVKNTLKMPTGLLGPDLESINLSLLPNPNQGKGLLRYQLEEKERVRIVVYDALGRQVKLLQSYTEQAAGAYQLPLDLTEQRPGVYFIHVETAEGQSGVIRWLYID